MPTKLSIDIAQELARQRDGQCLTKVFLNSGTKLEWQCAKGHRWTSLYHTIKRGFWCPDCSGKRKYTLEQMQGFAKQRGGKCLSTSYKNINSQLLWQCDKGHKWLAIPSSIINANHWCHECGGTKKKTLEEIKAFAKSKGGQCLSTSYNHNKEKLWWQCTKGHKWQATPHAVMTSYNSWCAKCSGKSKPTIQELRDYAKLKGGKLLSKAYVNNSSKLSWKCIDGHTFEMKWASVKNSGQWCSQCNLYFTEEKCRFILEYLLQTKFKKTRLLLGNRLELDGYSEEYNLAFEYNGIQHYENKVFFHSNNNSLEATQGRDKLKAKLIEEKGINIIYIPDFADKIRDGLVGYILNSLRQLNISLIKNPQDIPFEDFPKTISILKKLNKIAKQRGGKLVSKEYKGNHIKLEWECKEKHRWLATPANVEHRKSWCLKCSGSGKKTIEQMQTIAKTKGGKCLSEKYINLKTKLHWQCSKGHLFWLTPSYLIHRNLWCPDCKLKRPKYKQQQKRVSVS